MSKKPVFLIMAVETLELEQLTNDIIEGCGAEVEAVSTSNAVAARLMKGNVTCVVINGPMFDDETIKVIATWRLLEPKLAVISISSEISKDVFAFEKKVKQVVLFERPYMQSDFKVICQRVINGEMIYLRQHERFSTHHQIAIENIATREYSEGVLRNMSRGGAFLEATTLFGDHDILKLTITLEKIAKSHTMYGEVIRVSPDAFAKGRHGIGVRYISPEDLYTALLDTSKK